MHLSPLSPSSSSASPFCISDMSNNLLNGFRVSFLSPVSEQWNWQRDSCLPVCLPVLYSLLLPPPSVITSSTAHRLTIRWGWGHKHRTTSSHRCGILNSPPVWEPEAKRRLFTHQRCHSLRANQPVGIRNAEFCFASLEGLAHPSLVHHLGIVSFSLAGMALR